MKSHSPYEHVEYVDRWYRCRPCLGSCLRFIECSNIPSWSRWVWTVCILWHDFTPDPWTCGLRCRQLHTTSKLIGPILRCRNWTKHWTKIMEKIMESLQSRQESWHLFRPVQVFESWSWLANGEVAETRWQRWQRWMGYRWLQMATVDVLKIWLWFLCGFQRSFSRCVADPQWSARPRGGLCFEGAGATSSARLLSWPGGNQKVLTPGDRKPHWP